MSTLNESLTRTETPLATGEAALPVTAPVERVEKSSTVTQVAATSTPARKHSGFGIASFVWVLWVGLGILTFLGCALLTLVGFVLVLDKSVTAEVGALGTWPEPKPPQKSQ